jgi:hypothetical protein
VVHRDVRRARCRRFPYALFFRVVGGTLQVIACSAANTTRAKWQRRSEARYPAVML